MSQREHDLANRIMVLEAEKAELLEALEELETSIQRKWGGEETEKRRANALSPRIEEALEVSRTVIAKAKGGNLNKQFTLDGRTNGLFTVVREYTMLDVQCVTGINNETGNTIDCHLDACKFITTGVNS